MSTSEKAKERQRIYNKAYYEKNKETLKERSRKWRLGNKEKSSEYMEKYRKDNREKVASISRKSYRKIKKSNPEYFLKKDAARRARELQAIFVGGDQEFYDFFMEEIYSMSTLRTKMTGVQHNVDHIIPLKSKTVCGLHTPHNLQILTETANKEKSNSYDNQ